MNTNPKRIFCFSGKRKCGKDYVAEILHEELSSENSVIIRISAPIKQFWAAEKNLDYQQLLSNGAYKETYRVQMIEWSEEQRAKDPGFFCRAAVQIFHGDEHPIWIVSDLRRASDLEFFRNNYKDRVTTIRIAASESVRKQRGFNFTAGVDDVDSECGLDQVSDWDLIMNNDGEKSILKSGIQSLVNLGRNL
uniref:Phosphomevalonate kinase n=1 Tax=Evadne anonyx TaxID=141404 RepID=A0A9N6WU25_9CRUS|nr:EOG090X0FYC [Evadne anonyx]